MNRAYRYHRHGFTALAQQAAKGFTFAELYDYLRQSGLRMTEAFTVAEDLMGGVE